MSESPVDKFKEDIRFRDKIAHIETIPGKKAEYTKVNDLDPKFIEYLDDKGIKLYKHQAESINSIRNNENIIITTPTASGKTLAFNIPVLETLNEDSKATALYIYPAKALSYDQLDVLKKLEEGLKIDIKPATYDGDTPKSSRYNIRQKSRIVLTNPYQLHHILAWHHQWKRFYSNLKYIIIDESHYYKGIFGSNVSFLIRRLKRICNFYGSHPQFILSSATLANPLELAERLTGEKFTLINKDTSPSGDKDFILYNPYQKKTKKNSKDAPSIHQETEYIFLFLLLKDVQTLCFTVSRKIAELIAMWAKNDMLQYKRQLTHRITAYRAGYLAKERREIEEGLKNRKYLGVTCTNALELGINIGTLDAVIISGYPGTMISVWQQGGRAGRGTSKSLVILVAFENQLDQYFMKNPTFFFDKPHENVVIDLNNPILIKSHLICAANELPYTINEAKEYFNANSSILNELVSKKEITVSNELYTYPYDDSPSFTHSLDQLSNDLFKVMNKNNLLEVMERSQMYREAHPGAVLINKGETYIVDNVNLKSHYINVIKHKVNYHTTVLKNVDINIISKIRKERFGDFLVHFGELEVSEDYHRYKKIQFSKTVGSYILDLPPLNFRTKGLWFTIPESVKDKLEDLYEDDDVFAGGLHGTEHALIGLFPLHVMCDRFDIGGLSTNYHKDTQEATIFIYDAYEGGIGITEKAMEVFIDLVKSTRNLLDNCECEDGCPSCIYSPKCGNDNKPLHKKATQYILHYMCDLIQHNQKEDEEIVKELMESEFNPEKKTQHKRIYNNDYIIKEEKDDDFNDNKFSEALNFYDSGNLTYAKEICNELLNENKTNANALYLIGAILNKQEDKHGAVSFLKKAIKINPAHIEANELLIELEK